MRRITSALLAAILSLALVVTASAATESLRGSPSSMVRQNSVAKQHGLPFIKTGDELSTLVEEGALVPLPGNDDYVVLDGVSYPYAVPEVRVFIERLAAQYREGTGEKLVVTSLTRPTSEQPRNSHQLSVHPAGIAFDLRISSKAKSRQWLESVLLKLERSGLLDVTRERYPPHYHVALFPTAYTAYLEGMIGEDAVAEALDFEVEPVELAEESAEVQKEAAIPAKTVAAALPAVTNEDHSCCNVFLAVIPLLLVLLGLAGFWRLNRAGKVERQ